MSRKRKISPKIEVPQNELQQLVRKEVRAELFQGPMPHPDHLAKYENLYPGAAKLLFGLLEKQTNHRINLEKGVVASNIVNEKRGQIFAFILCLAVIGGGIALAIMDKHITGFASILSGLGTIVTVFIVGKRRERKELARKR